MDEMLEDELKRLRDYSITPDERLWSSIMSAIQAQDRSAALKRRTRKGWMLLTVIAILGGLVLDRGPSTLTRQTGPAFNERPETATVPNPATGDAINERISDKDSQGSWKGDEEKLDDRGKCRSDNVRAMEYGQRNTQGDSNAKASELKEQRSRIQATSEEFHSSTGAKVSSRAAMDLNLQNSVTTTSISAGAKDHSSHSLRVSDAPSAHELDTSGLQITVESQALAKVIDGDFSIPGEVGSSTIRKPGDSSAIEQPIVVKQQKRNRNFRLYFNIMPTLGYQRIEANDHDNLIVESIHRVAAFSPERLGVRAEAGIEVPVFRKLNFFSGLVYYQREQTVGYVEKQVEYVDVINGENGQITTKPQFAYLDKSFEYQVKNAGLQVGVNYQLKSAAILQTMGTGLEFHVPLNRKSQPNPDFTSNPSVYVFYNLYYRLEYPADTRLRAVFQPTLNYSFYISKDVNAPFYVKPYGLGLNLGATYHF